MSYTGSPYYDEMSRDAMERFVRQPWRWPKDRYRKIFLVMMDEGVLVIDNQTGGCSRMKFPTIMEAERYCEDAYDGGYG